MSSAAAVRPATGPAIARPSRYAARQVAIATTTMPMWKPRTESAPATEISRSSRYQRGRLRREDVLAEPLPVLERVDARQVDALVVVGVGADEPPEEERLRDDEDGERERLREPCSAERASQHLRRAGTGGTVPERDRLARLRPVEQLPGSRPAAPASRRGGVRAERLGDGRSVESRSVKQRTPRTDVSSWTPPESVATKAASASSPRKSR